jgi:hypothetical protein
MAVSSHSTIFRRSDLPRLGAPALTLLLRWTLREADGSKRRRRRTWRRRRRVRGGRGFGEEGGEGGVEIWGTRGGGLRVGTSDSEREEKGRGETGRGAESTSRLLASPSSPLASSARHGKRKRMAWAVRPPASLILPVCSSGACLSCERGLCCDLCERGSWRGEIRVFRSLLTRITSYISSTM